MSGEAAASSDSTRALNRRLIVGGTWATIDGWASEFMNLAVFLLLARLLGPEDFGIVALTATFTAFATSVVVYAVMQVLIQRADLEPGHCDAVFLLTFVGSLVAALLLVLFASTIATLFDEPLMVELLPWLCLMMPLQALGAVPLGLLTRELRFGATARRTLLMIVCGGIVGIVMAYRGYGPWALVGQHLTGSLISAVVLMLSTSWRPGLRARRSHFREVRHFIVAATGNHIFQVVSERAPVLVVGYFLGASATGIFALALRLVDVLGRLFITPVNQIAVPGIAAVQNDPERVRDLWCNMLSLASFVAAAVSLGAAVIAPHVLPLALGAQWKLAVPVFQILVLRGLIWPHFLLGQSLLYGLGRPERLLVVNRLDLVADIALLIIAAQFGLAAVAAISVLRLAIWRLPLLAREVVKLAGIGPLEQVRPLVLAAFTASCMAAAAWVMVKQLAMYEEWYSLLAVPPAAILYLIISAILNRRPIDQIRLWLRASGKRLRGSP